MKAMSKKPRLTYLHQYFVPPGASGGTRSYEFARRLVNEGYEVTLITSNAMLPSPRNECTKTQDFWIDGIRIIAIPQPYSNRSSFSQRKIAFARFAALASLEVLRHPSDIIFATSTPLTIIIPALFAKLRSQAPMIFEVRDLWPELPVSVGALKSPFLKQSAKAMEWVAYHSSRHVVALSPGMAEGVIRRGIGRKDVTVISNSSDLELFEDPSMDTQWVRPRLGLSPDQALVVYTGTLGLMNGVSYFARLAAESKAMGSKTHFLVVGDGMEREKIEQIARELGVLDSNFSMWKPLAKKKVREVICAADLATSLFIPLKEMENNSANKFFDALAAGKPIAINYGGWQKEILEESGAGLSLSQHDLPLAARTLDAFLRNDVAMRSASIASKKLAKSQFDRDLLFSKLHRIFQATLGSDFHLDSPREDPQDSDFAVAQGSERS